jgi:uncharacterized protein YoxC
VAFILDLENDISNSIPQEKLDEIKRLVSELNSHIDDVWRKCYKVSVRQNTVNKKISVEIYKINTLASFE